MEIRQNSISYNQNNSSFKALPLSKIKMNGTTIKDEITILQLSKKDIPFLKKMYEKIDLKKLYPDVKNIDGFKEWKQKIEHAIIDIQDGAEGLLAVRENKPCAIMSFFDSLSQKGYFIDDLAAWPIRPGEGTKGGGRAIIRQFFEKCRSEEKTKAFLIPSCKTPRNKACTDFYESVGFRRNTHGIVEIVQPKNEELNIFEHASNTLDGLMNYSKIRNSKEIDLNQHMNIDYTKGFINRLKQKLTGYIQN